MEISLLRRAAIVTGGSKGIGFAVAARFAASGADVAIVARTAEPLKEAVAAIRKSTQSRHRGSGRCQQGGRRSACVRRGDGGVRQSRHRRQQCGNVTGDAVR